MAIRNGCSCFGEIRGSIGSFGEELLRGLNRLLEVDLDCRRGFGRGYFLGIVDYEAAELGHKCWVDSIVTSGHGFGRRFLWPCWLWKQSGIMCGRVWKVVLGGLSVVAFVLLEISQVVVVV